MAAHEQVIQLAACHIIAGFGFPVAGPTSDRGTKVPAERLGTLSPVLLRRPEFALARIVLLLTKTPWDDRRQFHRQGPALVDRGHEVFYVAAQPTRSVEHPFTWVELDERDLFLARRTGGLNLFGRIAKLRPDLVQLCSLELLPLGFALKARRVTRVVYDCREDIASALYERRKSLPKLARRLVFEGVRALERRAARLFDGIVTADPGVFELHAEMPAERKHVFYNTALLSQFPPTYPKLADREFDVVLLGSMSSLRSGADTVLDALGLLARDGQRLRALFIGEPTGDVGPAIEERIARYGLENQVIVTGHLPHAEVAAQIARGRIGIVPLHDYPKFHRNIACKAFEYMACGMPTIASDLPPQHIFLHDGIARFYPCGDVDRLAARIADLGGQIEICQQMGDRARRDVEAKWNGEAAQRAYCDFYESLLEKPERR